MKAIKLILVIGPPRSGTSVTARILHEKLGVCMGHHLVQGNPGNPKGFYEDSKYVRMIVNKKLTELSEALNHGCKIVGVKSPELAFTNFAELNPDLVIRTTRELMLNAGSLEKYRQPKISLGEAMLLVEQYHRNIYDEVRRGYLPNHLIDLTHLREEDDIEKELFEAYEKAL